MRVIGISGKAGAGKDTAKDLLFSYFTHKGINAVPLSFAGPLKDALVLWFGWDRQRLDSDFPYKEGGLGNAPGLADDVDPFCVALGMTRREIMQKFGTECMRDGMHSNFWIILAEIGIRTGRLKGDVFIVSDARFPNELDWITSMNGVTILVERLVIEKGKTALDMIDSGSQGGTLTDKTGHASETQFEKWFAEQTTGTRMVIANEVNKNLAVEESKLVFQNLILESVIPHLAIHFGGFR